ncbi:hypothetical protein HZS_780, partial [Henneguya salminicola]
MLISIMEEIFTAISREAGIMKLEVLKEATSMALRRTEAESTSPGFDIRFEIKDDDFKILLSQRIESLDENLPKLILEAISNSTKLEEDMHISIMKIILTIWNTHNIELSFSVIKGMIDQCCSSFTESKQELSRAASQATLSHILSNICEKLNESSNSSLEKISKKINLNFLSKNNSVDITSPLMGYCVVLSAKLAAILNHLSDKIDIVKNDSSMSIFIKKNSEKYDSEDNNIHELTVNLLHSIVIHIEFYESIRLNFLKILLKFLSQDYTNILNNKLEFIKDIFESIFAFSNLFLITSSNLKSDNCTDLLIDHENILRILAYLRQYSTNNQFQAEKITVQKCIIMLILTLDEVLINKFGDKIPNFIDKCCSFHQTSIDTSETSVFFKDSIKHGKILNLPTFKICRNDYYKQRTLSNMLDDSISNSKYISACSNNSSKKKTQNLGTGYSKSLPCLCINQPKISKWKSCILSRQTEDKQKIPILRGSKIMSMKHYNPMIENKNMSRNENKINATNIKETEKKRHIYGENKTAANQKRFNRPTRARIVTPDINKLKNEKNKKDELLFGLINKFFDQLFVTVENIVNKKLDSYVKIDKKFRKFAFTFIYKFFTPLSNFNQNILIDIYAEDIYYSAICLIIVSNYIHFSEFHAFNLEEFYNFKFYRNEPTNGVLIEFKKALIKHLYTNTSFVTLLNVPDDSKSYKSFIYQLAIIIFPDKFTKNNEILHTITHESLKVYDIILESLLKIYSESGELINKTQIEESNSESNECEFDIRLEAMCLLSCLSCKIGKWKIFDRISSIIVKMALNDDNSTNQKFYDRIEISKVVALQTIMSCAYNLVNTCCIQSTSWNSIFICCSYIVKLKSNYFDNSEKVIIYNENSSDSEASDSDSPIEEDTQSDNFLYKMEESYLSHHNSMEAISYLFSSMKELFTLMSKKQTLGDIIYVLQYLFNVAREEFKYINKSKKAVDCIAADSTEYLFTSYVNIVIDLLNKKSCNLLFLNIIFNEIIQCFIYILNMANRDYLTAKLLIIEFFSSYIKSFEPEKIFFTNHNYYIGYLIKELINTKDISKNIVFELIVEFVSEASFNLGSYWNSLIVSVQSALEFSNINDGFIYELEALNLILLQLPQAAKIRIYCVPDMIVNLLSLYSYFLNLISKHYLKTKLTEKIKGLLITNHEITCEIFCMIGQVLPHWKIIEYYSKKTFKNDINFTMNCRERFSNENLEKYIKYQFSNNDEKEHGFYNIYLRLIDGILFYINLAIMKLYYDHFDHTLSSNIIRLYEVFLDSAQKLSNSFYISTSYYMLSLIEICIIKLRENHKFKESFQSIRQLSFLFSNQLTNMFITNSDLSSEYSNWLEDIIRKSLKIFSDLSQFEDNFYSRLGCSCFKHILIKYCEQNKIENLETHIRVWKIFIEFLHINIAYSLENFKIFISSFAAGSRNVQGDLYKIKIVEKITEDNNEKEIISSHILHSARQIFQTQIQIDQYEIDDECIESECKNYLIIGTQLIFHNGNMVNKEIFRLVFSQLMSELMANQVMLNASNYLLDHILNEVLKSINRNKSVNDSKKKSVREILNKNCSNVSPIKTTTPMGTLILDILNELKIILKQLQIEWEIGQSFEARPGLKFLLQRMCFLKYPANYIKASTLSFSSYLVCLFRLCCFDITATSHNINNTKIEKKEFPRLSLANSIKNTSLRKTNTFQVAKLLNSPSNNSSTNIGLNTSKYNIGELKDIFSKLCIIIDALQEQISENSTNSSNYLEIEESLRKNESCTTWFENIKALKNLCIFEGNEINENWTTKIGTVEEWQLERKFQLESWINVLRKFLEFVLQQSNPQFKLILPALFKPLSTLIAAAGDSTSQKMLSEVIMRCGI